VAGKSRLGLLWAVTSFRYSKTAPAAPSGACPGGSVRGVIVPLVTAFCPGTLASGMSATGCHSDRSPCRPGSTAVDAHSRNALGTWSSPVSGWPSRTGMLSPTIVDSQPARDRW